MPGVENQNLAYEILHNSDGSYGYKILKGEKPMIIQEVVPGAQGVSGFTTRVHAEQVALLVIKKINNGDFPPTINEFELDSLMR